MLIFHKTYFLLAFLLFCLEVFIALFVKDHFVRPYLGDTLVVALLYALVKSFFKLPVKKATAGVLLFAFTVEFLQFIHIVHLLGLEKYYIARVIIGTSFSWLDILSYMAGAVIVLLIEIPIITRDLKGTKPLA